MKEESLKVPGARHEVRLDETDFIDRLKKVTPKSDRIQLDFQGLICISSMVLGAIVWMARRHESVVFRFNNVHWQLYEDLHRMIGVHLKKFCDGPVNNEPSLADAFIFRNGEWCKG